MNNEEENGIWNMANENENGKWKMGNEKSKKEMQPQNINEHEK